MTSSHRPGQHGKGKERHFWEWTGWIFPPGRLQGLQTGGWHSQLPASIPSVLPALRQRWAMLRPAFHHLGTGMAGCRHTDRQCPLVLLVPCHQPGTTVRSPLSPWHLYPGWSSQVCASSMSITGTGASQAPSHSLPIPERTSQEVGGSIKRGTSSCGRGWGEPVGVLRRGEDREGFLFKRSGGWRAGMPAGDGLYFY